MSLSLGMIFDSLEAFPDKEKQFPISGSSDNHKYSQICFEGKLFCTFMTVELI